MNVKFSIIMPTYNRKYCIKNAIDSLLRQTYQDFELIIIDDGSTDETEKYVKELYRDEILKNKINYINLGEHKGVSFARNIGLENAKNEWIGYLDTDNTMLPFFLETFAVKIKENLNYSVFYAQIKTQPDDYIFGHPFDFERLLIETICDMGVFVHKVDLFKELGGFNIDLKRAVDWDLFIRYTSKNKPFFIEKVLLLYDHDLTKDRITNNESLQEAYKKIIINYLKGIPEYRFMEEYQKNFLESQKKDKIIYDKQKEINVLKNSTSWKITKPFRIIADKFKKLITFIKYSFVVLRNEGVFSLVKRTMRFFYKKVKN